MHQGNGSLEDTPTWAVSIVCLALTLLSILIEAALQLLTKFLKRRKRKSLNRALRKIKTELMILGFISLLLTVAEVPISKICVSEAVGNSFLPCEDPFEFEEPAVSSATEIPGSNKTATTESMDESSCEAKGMISLVSREGIKQLHIFIFVLAVFHVLYCVLTMCLGIAKMRRWEAWEEETQTLEYQIANDPRRFRLTRQTSFGRRHLKFWSDHPLLLWPVCFLRQFSCSVKKSDYFTLRNGFIVAHFAKGSNYNFQKFLSRAFDDDFEQVVGISFWIWIFSIFFIFFSAHGFYNYFWLPFIPLSMVLVVGMKLEVIITKMCLESRNKTEVVQGTFLVKPNDELFWFGRPHWLLHLIHFILFQNSFQLAFFTWTWYEYGLRSCFHRETEHISLRIAMGLFVQFLCGYVTLPLFALVTQMGSGMKTAVFTEHVAKGLKHWHSLARKNLSRNKSTLSRQSSEPLPTDTTKTSFSDVQELGLPDYEQLPHPPVMSSPSSPEITEEAVQQHLIAPTINSCSSVPEITEEAVQHHHIASENIFSSPPEITEEAVQHKDIIRGTYDGEISFGTSWKELESEKGIANITSALDETSSDILTEL